MGWFRFSYRLILLPSFAGLACYACKPTANTAIGISPPTETATAANEVSVDTEPDTAKVAAINPSSTSQVSTSSTAANASSAVSIAASSSAYQEGINLASSAHTLSQSALSPDDWGLIASRWERAAAQLQKVNQQDENYEQAQQKAREYTLNAEAAKAHIAELQAPVYVPLPAEVRTRISETPSLATQQSRPTATPPASSQTIQIPIVRRLHGTPIVRVTFNHSKTYEMILDTGASRTLITRQMAQDLGVVATERMIAATASQAEVSFDIGRVSAISMGDIVLENARVSIGDAVDIGLLGNDFLQGYDGTIRAHTGFVELSKAY